MGLMHGRGHGQASLEMTISLVGAMLLVLGSFKVVLWLNQRLILRQRAYNLTRVAAGSQSLAGARNNGIIWTDPTKVDGGVHRDDPCYEETVGGVRIRPYNNRLHIFERNVNCDSGP